MQPKPKRSGQSQANQRSGAELGKEFGKESNTGQQICLFDDLTLPPSHELTLDDGVANDPRANIPKNILKEAVTEDVRALRQACRLARRLRRGRIPRTDKHATRLAICQQLIAGLGEGLSEDLGEDLGKEQRSAS